MTGGGRDMTEELLKRLICAAIESFPINEEKKAQLRRKLTGKAKKNEQERGYDNGTQGC